MLNHLSKSSLLFNIYLFILDQNIMGIINHFVLDLVQEPSGEHLVAIEPAYITLALCYKADQIQS